MVHIWRWYVCTLTCKFFSDFIVPENGYVSPKHIVEYTMKLYNMCIAYVQLVGIKCKIIYPSHGLCKIKRSNTIIKYVHTSEH